MLHLGDSLGAIFLGNIVTAVLFGLTTVQAYTYCRRSNKDSLGLRTLVIVLWLIDCVHLAFVTYTVYSYAIIGFGNTSALEELIWSIPAFIVATAISDLIVRSIFCNRVWRLSETKWHCGLVLAIIVTGAMTFAMGMTFAFEAITTKTLRAFSEGVYSRILYTGLSSAAVGDVTIAASLCILLSGHRGGLPKRSDHVVRTIILYSIETGVLTSICAIACLIIYALMPDNYVYIALYMMLSKLALNSLLASLNVRPHLREASGIISTATYEVDNRTMMQQNSEDGQLTSGVAELLGVDPREVEEEHIGPLRMIEEGRGVTFTRVQL